VLFVGRAEGDELMALVVDAVERLGVGVETYLALWDAGVSHCEVEECLRSEWGLDIERVAEVRRAGFSHAELMALGEVADSEELLLGRYLILVLGGFSRGQVLALDERGVGPSVYSRPSLLGAVKQRGIRYQPVTTGRGV
jgi:hypothetical protein